MTAESATTLAKIQINIRWGYNRNDVRIIFTVVSLRQGQDTVDKRIRELKLEEGFGFLMGARIFCTESRLVLDAGPTIIAARQLPINAFRARPISDSD